MRNFLATVMVVAIALAAKSTTAAAVCGDVNDNGKVTSADALAVLRKAVGQSVELICAQSSTPAQTGETVSHGPGSDGNVQAGTPRQFTDNGDGTVTDDATGLMWEKKDRSGGLHDVENTYSFSATGTDMDGTLATDFLAGINAGGGFAGHTDWRIPNVVELETIKNFGDGFNASTFAEFDSDCAASCTVADCSCTRLDSYWSSTTHANNPIEGWIVGFNGPGTDPAGKIGSFKPVRAVRNAN
ncbi:MAG TPA: DUF1566 domain-containing protein [Candidatus Binatia bacterium]|jgi:hypothetical protein